MTDKQRLNALRRAVKNLKLTTKGYRDAPDGVFWVRAMESINEVMSSLEPSPHVPGLGPVVAGGVSILAQDLTHPTSGIPLYPAFDDGWAVGRDVIAPEDLEVTRQSSSQGGDAFYAEGRSGIRYWFGHIDHPPQTGAKFKKGARMADISADHPRPHVHVGINVEKLAGEGVELIHHKNYTHGAPKIGVQLKALLDV